MKDANKQLFDVIIAGAGPVGLFLACELALAKCSVLVVEKAPDPSSPLKKIPFGIRGLSAPSVEAFYRRALLDELEVPKRLKNPHANTAPGAQRQVGHFAGIPLIEANVDTTKWKHRLPSSTETSLVSEMEELETVLTRRAQSLGVEIRRGFAVTTFQANETDVAVQSDNHTFSAQWLVGCDGARSVVRKLGGFDFVGTEPEFTGYSTKVEIADPEKLKPGRNLTATGMYLQSQPGFIVIQDFDGGAFHNSGEALTVEHLQKVLRRISETDVAVSVLQYATTWTDRARQTTSYRRGRVLLAGDAAHIHSPLGGQGLNLGLGDAMNLGWKLAATIKGLAPSGLLDSYQSERHPVGVQVLDWSRAQVAIMKPEPKSRALNAIFRDVINTRDGATYFASRVWGVFTHYDLGGEHELTGYSVPNFEFEDNSKVGELMRDGRGLLLDFTRNDSLKALAAKYRGQLQHITQSPKIHLGLSAALIRPDGIIAWAASGTVDSSALEQALNRWFRPN